MTVASPTPGEPSELDALIALAQREHHAGRLAEAAAAYDKVLAIEPNIAGVHFKLGNVLKDQEKFDEAAARYEQAIALRPDYAQAYYHLGTLLSDRGKLDEAATRFQQVIALRPDHAGAHYNLGNTLKQLDRLDQARARYEQAIALRPDYAKAYNNLGNVLLIQGKLDEAVARYEQALALRPDYAGPQLGLAACHLIEEDYARGWPAYEARLRVPGLVHRCSLPRWEGESLAGRSLLLLAEQGLGDTLQFVRYARAVKERGARVVLVAQPALGRLLANHPDVDELFLLGSTEELPRSDFYLPLLSAPCAFGTGAETIPCDVPYLAAEPGLTDRWRGNWPRSTASRLGLPGKARANFRWIDGVRFRWPILRRWPVCPACG